MFSLVIRHIQSEGVCAWVNKIKKNIIIKLFNEQGRAADAPAILAIYGV